MRLGTARGNPFALAEMFDGIGNRNIRINAGLAFFLDVEVVQVQQHVQVAAQRHLGLLGHRHDLPRVRAHVVVVANLPALHGQLRLLAEAV